MEFLIVGLIAVISVLAVVWWYLHRDPDRADPNFDGFISPANGIVVDIIEREPQQKSVKIKKASNGITAFFDDFPEGKTIIVIMMKPHHIHTQRAPLDGRIVQMMHRPGLKLNAVFGDYRKATAENEHAMYTIQGNNGKRCKVYAIAGLLARRVRPIAKIGDQVVQGQRISKITFGSQVAIVLPKATLKVAIGQTVIDGVTELAQ